MPIATADDIQEYARLDDKATLAAKRRLRRAERWVRQRVGSDDYDAAARAEPRSEAAEVFAEAEALYAASRALVAHGLKSKGAAGFVEVIQVDGSQSERLMRPRQIKAYASYLEDEAKETLAPYVGVTYPDDNVGRARMHDLGGRISLGW